MNKRLKIFLMILLIILIIAIISLTLLKVFNNNKEEEIASPYSNTAISIMENMNLYDEINNKEYSKTIEVL